MLPATFALAPLISVFIASGIASTTISFVGAAALSGITVLAAGWARDRGRAAQQALWDNWGGKPTTAGLRWSSGLPAATVGRRHASISSLSTMDLPNRSKESLNPLDADLTYDLAVGIVRSKLREDPANVILSDASADYGLRRNAFGLRWYGRVFSGAALVGAVAMWVAAPDSAEQAYVIAAAIALVFLIGWFLIARGSWVKAAADVYAENFFETAEKAQQQT